MNGEIIDLEGEPEPARPQWRPGSLTLVAVPVLTIAVIAVALWSAGHPTSDVAVPSDRPTQKPLGIEFFSLPPGIIATRPPQDVPIFWGDTRDPEMLKGEHWTGLGPTGYVGRGDVADAVLDGDAYVIGGSTEWGREIGSSEEEGQVVWRYDRLSGLRMRAADLPISLDSAMAATLGDRIFVFGGFHLGKASARVFSLGANDAKWVEHSQMPAPRAAGGAAVVGQRVYIVGGVGSDGRWVQDTWTYDTRGGWYVSLARLPTPRDHLAVGTHEGRVCAAGGRGGELAFECYEPRTDTWTPMPDLRRPVVGARAAEVAGLFWVIEHDVHVFAVDHWHFGPRLLRPRQGHAVVVIDEALYVIEGFVIDGLAGIQTLNMERLTPHP